MEFDLGDRRLIFNGRSLKVKRLTYVEQLEKLLKEPYADKKILKKGRELMKKMPHKGRDS